VLNASFKKKNDTELSEAVHVQCAKLNLSTDENTRAQWQYLTVD